MPHPWDISSGKQRSIDSLVAEEAVFHRARIRRGDHDSELGPGDLGSLADRIASEAMIPIPEVGLDDWTASMDEHSDASRVTYTIPFQGEEQIVRLALDWRSGGHAIAVLPDSIQYSVWSRDKDAATIRTEADTVMAPIAQRWQSALTQLETYNTRARAEILTVLEERRHAIGARVTLLEDLNRHNPIVAGHDVSRRAVQP